MSKSQFFFVLCLFVTLYRKRQIAHVEDLATMKY